MVIISSFSTKTNSLYTKQTLLNFFHIYILLSLYVILSFILNCLELQAYQTYKTVYYEKGKHVFIRLTMMCRCFFSKRHKF